MVARMNSKYFRINFTSEFDPKGRAYTADIQDRKALIAALAKGFLALHCGGGVFSALYNVG